MASKSKGSKSGTPVQQPQRPSSPLSPTRHSRIQEKQDLANLNDRLACYIDRVRHLETENSRLTREIQTTEETVTREVTNIKSMYDNELSEARKLLDETHRDRARLEIDVKRLFEENDSLKTDLVKKTKALQMAESTARVMENRCDELQLKYNQAIADAKKAAADLKDLEKERDKLRKQVDASRKQLEEEALARVDVENSNQSLREELTFKDQLYHQQLSETRVKRQMDLTEIDGRLSEKYEEKLQEHLQELRDQYENQMLSNRQEITLLYERKIQDLENEAARRNNAASTALEELRVYRSKLDSLSAKISELENQNAGLGLRNKDLERLLEKERLQHAEDLAVLNNEITRLREEMSTQLQEYRDLMDIKVSLDLEIAAYRKLLESEEARLNITPSGLEKELHLSTRSSARRTPVRGSAKRKRTLLEESHDMLSDYSVTSSSKGDIEVAEVDPEGRFVKLHNKSNDEVALGGWQVVRKCGENETQFKFHRTVKLEGNGLVTIWSSDTNQDHEPPHNLVMKGQKWVVGDNMVTLVYNNDGEEIAVSERVRRQLSSSSMRHRDLGYLGSEELHHQQGDPQGDEKCRLM